MHAAAEYRHRYNHSKTKGKCFVVEEIIKKIIETDERAAEIVADAELSYKQLGEAMDKEIGQLKRDIALRAQQRCESVREYEDAEAQRKITEINQRTKEAMQRLEDKLNENKEKWIEDIFNTVVGV